MIDFGVGRAGSNIFFSTVSFFGFVHAACRVHRFRGDQDRPSGREQARLAPAARQSRRATLQCGFGGDPRQPDRAREIGQHGLWPGGCDPHGKIEGIERIYGLFARISEPVDYKAIDGRKVDLVFLLLSPPDAGAEHLKALAAISRVIRDGSTLEKMRGARSRDALAAVLLGADERDAA